MKPTRSTTSTTETRIEIRELRKLIRRQKVLTDKEEQILRMRHGIGEPDIAKLQFRGQSHEETRIKLAMMEREFLADQRQEHVDPDLSARKQRIVEKLRKL